MKNLNGWAKVLTLIVAIAIQLMVLSNNNGRRDEAIDNLKTGQSEIKADIKALENQINDNMGNRYRSSDAKRDFRDVNNKLDKIQVRVNNHIENGKHGL